MPELVELEVLRRDLEKEIVGRRVKQVEVRPGPRAARIIARHPRRKDFIDALTGAKLVALERRGRWLVFGLEDDRALAVTPGPAARLLKTAVSDEVEPNTQVVITFTIGGQLRYVDATGDGEMFVAPRAEIDALHATGAALDPLDGRSPPTWQSFSQLLTSHRGPIKRLLMDDGFVVGLGDLYSDEVLFAAGLRYDRSPDRLSSQDVRRLYRSLLEVLMDAVKARGASVGDDAFVDLQGSPGAFQDELKVYGREGQPCRRCRNTIVKEPFDGGYSYLCPRCQA